MGIQTILFDLDGTLIDTNELIIQSFLHTFKCYGKECTREEAIDFIGPPLRESLANISPEPADIDEYVTAYREHNLDVHDDYVTVFPDVMGTLQKLKDAGIKMGVVTTKMRPSVEKGMTSTGITSFFDTIVTIDDVTHAKPHPEPVIKALETLKGNANTTLMVGDNYHDIEAGQHAGVLTAGVAWSLKGKDFLNSYHPTYMLESMKDLLKLTGVK